jgi:hypothetical protein
MAAEAFVRIDLLAACVPSADDDLQGAYLAAAAGPKGEPMAVVLMVSDAFAIEGALPARSGWKNPLRVPSSPGRCAPRAALPICAARYSFTYERRVRSRCQVYGYTRQEVAQG